MKCGFGLPGRLAKDYGLELEDLLGSPLCFWPCYHAVRKSPEQISSERVIAPR